MQSANLLEQGQILGCYELQRELGRGGMGVVYRAIDRRDGRVVALKVLASMVGLESGAIDRFRLEAETTARLEHSGIIDVFEFGELEGVHWFSMELIEGPSLFSLLHSLQGNRPDQLIGTLAEETALDEVLPALRRDTHSDTEQPGSRYARSCARFCAEVADALVVAHRHRVLHRDIKPSNLLIRRDGRPVIVDFGLARDELAASLTRTGDAVGTPAYMAPEQARGDREVDGRVDVYGLGATLYEMLTLRAPFEGAHAGEIMRKIVDQEAVSLRSLNYRVPTELAAVVETCLQKHPDDRYQSVEALAEDLRAFDEGRPIAAPRPPLGRRLMRRIQHNPSLMKASLLAVFGSLCLFMLVGLAVVQNNQEEGLDALDRANTATGSEAFEAFGKARALLGDKRLQAEQRRRIHEVFDQLYAQGQLDALSRMLEQWPEESRDEEWQQMRARLEGAGVLRVADLPLDARVEVRSMAPGGVLSSWRHLSPSGRLPLGEHLVRVIDGARISAVRHVRVQRDSETRLVVPFLLSEEQASDLVAAVSDSSDTVIVARDELSVGSYAEILRKVEDSQLRKELLPSAWRNRFGDRDEQEPVRGLSHRQARIIAALAGAHLPDREEYLLAATGGMSALSYPWGRVFDASKVAAAPDQMTRPVPVHQHSSGASPLGALHMVGNVAEILAPLAGEPVQVAGGHFQSDQASLQVRALTPLSGQEEVAGMRLARFAESLASNPGVPWQMPATAGQAALWRLDSKGKFSHRLELRGTHPEARLEFPLRMFLGGFRVRGGVKVFDGSGGRMEVNGLSQPGRGPWDVRVRLSPQAEVGASYSFAAVAELEGIDALDVAHGSYRLSLPVRRGSFENWTVLELPRGAHLDWSTPQVHEQQASRDGLRLIWRWPEASAESVQALNVGFRYDGYLAPRVPALASASQQVAELTEGLNRRDRQLLTSQVDRFFRMPYCGFVWADSSDGDELPVQKFAEIEVEDVDQVGDQQWIRFRADWTIRDREDQELKLEQWPFVLKLALAGEARITSLDFAGSADRGKLVGSAYESTTHGVRFVPPPGVHVLRGGRGVCEVQVDASDPDLPGLGFSLRAITAIPGVEERRVMQQLTDAESGLRPGRRVPSDGIAFLGIADTSTHRHSDRVQEWLFSRGEDGLLSRERWAFLQLGRRWFFVRSYAKGRSAEEASARFAQGAEFFASMAGAVQIH